MYHLYYSSQSPHSSLWVRHYYHFHVAHEKTGFEGQSICQRWQVKAGVWSRWTSIDRDGYRDSALRKLYIAICSVNDFFHLNLSYERPLNILKSCDFSGPTSTIPCLCPFLGRICNWIYSGWLWTCLNLILKLCFTPHFRLGMQGLDITFKMNDEEVNQQPWQQAKALVLISSFCLTTWNYHVDILIKSCSTKIES